MLKPIAAVTNPNKTHSTMPHATAGVKKTK